MGQAERAHRTVRGMVRVLREHYHPQRVIMFGSLANGQWRKDSDIDLLIVKRTSVPFYRRLAEVRALVSDARRGFSFDPIVLTPAEVRSHLARGNQFVAGILATGKVLHG